MNFRPEEGCSFALRKERAGGYWWLLSVPVGQRIVCGVYDDGPLLLHVACQNLLRKVVHDVTLYRSLDRTGTVHRVIALTGQPLLCLGRHLQFDAVLGEHLRERTYLYPHDFVDVLFRERREHHDFVDTVQELRLERLLDPLEKLSMMRCEPMFEVMMMMVLRKSTVRPLLSVRRPSSSTCNKMLKTSGCAFSISSSSTTE